MDEANHAISLIPKRRRLGFHRPAALVIALSLGGLFVAAMAPARSNHPLRETALGRGSAVAPAMLPDVPPLPEGEAKDEPGLTLRIEPLGDAPAAGHADLRVVRLLAMYVPAGVAPTSLTSAGAYKATFEGDIAMRLRDFLIFSAEGYGKLTVTINGKPVLDLAGDFAKKPSESTRLNKGKNHIVAVYEPMAGKDAEVRLFWATKTTLPEPVPPTVLSHSNGDTSLRQSLRVREGRLLVAQFRCTKCHDVGDMVTAGDKDAMPELAMDAPSLAEAGTRLGQVWMGEWITNPHKFRPAAHMPRLFETKEAVAPEARDIAAYLSTLGAADPADAADSGNAEAGGQLFANLNCVACHLSPERQGGPQEAADTGRISLAYVKAKFKAGRLKKFLLNPSAHYAWIPMPNFRLSDDDARDLAKYLLSHEGQSVGAAAAGNPKTGEQLFHTAGCVNCHAIDKEKQAPQQKTPVIAFNTITKDGWKRGCMGADAAARSHAPDFSLTEAQRGAILAFAATDRFSLKRDNPAEFSQRQVVILRCGACHARDGHESLLATDLDTESQEIRGKFPAPQQGNGEGMAPDQRAPILTWAGGKLRPEWLGKFLAGQIPYKPRYYLRARMPGFGVRAERLAEGLTAEHGCATTYPAYAAPIKELAGVGQTLVGKTPNQSFGCVQCHSINQQPALAPFEAPAINFMHVTSRLREDYYYRWIHDPLRIDPETKMPRFDDADGKTGVPVFDNDARKQFEAIWNYLLIGKDIAPPAQ